MRSIWDVCVVGLGLFFVRSACDLVSVLSRGVASDASQHCPIEMADMFGFGSVVLFGRWH